MIKTFNNFFNFSGKENRKKFLASVWLGVLNSMLLAMKIPAAYLVIKGIIEGNLTAKTGWTAFAIVLASVICSTLISMKTTMLQTRAGYNTCAFKRIEIAEHMRYLPMGYFNDHSLGNITSVATNSMEVLANVAARVVMMTTKGFISAGVIILMMFFFDWRIGLIASAGMIIFFLINTFMQKVEKGYNLRKYSADEKMITKILEFIQGILEVKNYNLTKQSANEANEAIKGSNKAAFAMEVPSVFFMFLQMLSTKLTGVLMIIASIALYLKGQMDLTYTITMIICAFIIFESLDVAGNYSALLHSVQAIIDKANAILESPTMDIDGKDFDKPFPEIDLKNISFSYEKRKIINEVSVKIPAYTTTAIIGPSGGGKSTLCNLMARFWDVQSGEVCFGGHNVKEYNFDSLIKNFSFVFQRSYLFKDTIANNIRFGKPEATMEEVIEVAKKARCHDFISALPKGYDTVIGEGGGSISGGERQRLTIARAIMKDAPVIILDEATANVDPENEKDLIDAINELTRDKTVIMIAHRLKTVRHANQILVVDGGKIVQQGSHEELIAQDGIYKRFVGEREEAVSWKI